MGRMNVKELVLLLFCNFTSYLSDSITQSRAELFQNEIIGVGATFFAAVVHFYGDWALKRQNNLISQPASPKGSGSALPSAASRTLEWLEEGAAEPDLEYFRAIFCRILTALVWKLLRVYEVRKVGLFRSRVLWRVESQTYCPLPAFVQLLSA